MKRRVSVELEAEAEGASRLELAVAVAHGPALETESLEVSLDGQRLRISEVRAEHGGRVHTADVDRAGRIAVRYDAIIDGRGDPPPTSPLDPIVYLRPSRYCESDRLTAHARGEFAGLGGFALIDAVTDWVHGNIAYVVGSSRPIDGAVATLLARQGVCRDFAHLVIALLRACDQPARLAAVYAPVLKPMDFHAVAEVLVDGTWYVVDATRLAPRPAMLRIATGRDAADTAFLATYGTNVDLTLIDVQAVADGEIVDDSFARLTLG